MRVWRLASLKFAIFDGTGASLHGARWNSPGRRVVYAADSLASAVLEQLVRAGGSKLPSDFGFVSIQIPDDLPVECLEPSKLPGWDAIESPVARSYGDAWQAERRTAVLLVPSAIVPESWNAVINQDHPDFGRLRASEPRRLRWDPRL